MPSLTPRDPSAYELHEIATSVLTSIQQYRRAGDADHGGVLCQEITRLEQLVGRADPQGFTDEEFELIDNRLGLVVQALNDYVEHNVPPRNNELCAHFSHSIRVLEDARSWICQGYSPDPAKRPTDEELERRMQDSTRRAARELRLP